VNVLIVTGIWPPDVGGPASHAPEAAEFLRAHGHTVEVVTTAERAPAREAYPVRWTSRRLPAGARHAHGAALIARAARRADVVYATGLYVRSALACTLAARPLVVKLTSDPAYERGVWRDASRIELRVLRAVRDLALPRAAHVLTPSSFLRERALSWGLRPERVTVLPNPAPELPPLPAPAELRSRLGVDGRTLAFAGRLTVQKAVEVTLDAVARIDSVTLLVAGDGSERVALERRARELGIADRARFLGALDRRSVLEVLHAGDALVLSSSWENFPHAVVEALAVGTPVIATAVGGVTEVVEHEVNGLLVPPGDPAALAAAISRYFDDPELRERLRAATVSSVADYAPELVYGRLEQILAEAAS
jgi:glycosyltransferase involved in cell wall biosynthesis